ncbi:hypothetical protein D3Z58_16030 [Clostridiaceae bacterium]|nr:hypothetical protein [Clostridiaceae bacterium]
MGKKYNSKLVAVVFCSMVLFSAGIGGFLAGMDFLVARVQEEGSKRLQEDLVRACVRCYVAEGQYPPDVLYLKEHYKVSFPEEMYMVFYDRFASNVMPEIVVCLL